MNFIKNKYDEINFDNIVFTNDFHSNLPYKVNLIEKLIDYKNNNSLIIDNGDFSEGSAFYDFLKGVLEKYCLKSCYHVLIPGNHGFKDLLDLNDKSLILNCNIYSNNKPFFTEYKIFTINSYKVAIIGAISQEAFLSIPEDVRHNLNIIDPIIKVKELVKNIRNDVDFIVLCSHSGINFDKENFNIFGIDAIISGHCHSKLDFLISNNIKICKAKDGGRSIGVINFNDNNITFENKKIYTKKIKFEKKELISFNKEIRDYLTTFKEKIADIDKNIQIIRKRRKKFLEYLLKYINISNKIEYYCINYTFLRSSYQKDDYLCKEMLFNLVPFDTNLFIIKDTSINFNNFVSNIPKEIINKSILKTIKNSDRIIFITTEYLYNNFYKKTSSTVILNKINVRELITKIVLENTNYKGFVYE